MNLHEYQGKQLLEKYNVILRPHPESFKRSESKLKDIQKK